MLFSSPNQQQAIALAGLFQCCALVDELAQQGSTATDQFEACLEALFINSLNPYDVFSGSHVLSSGIEALRSLLHTDNGAPRANTIRYAVGVLQLATKLEKNPAMLKSIAEHIEQSHRMREHFELNHENIITNLAQLYQDTISTFSYRIQVHGLPTHLEQKIIAAKIRCLLFAAIRCAILWRRNGGRKHHLMFSRKRLLKLLDAMTT